MANPKLSKEQLTKCKMGQNKYTCAFIILSPDGFECARMDMTINQTIFKRIEAERIIAQGEGGWPGCIWDDELNQSGGN